MKNRKGARGTGRLPMYNITLSKKEEKFSDFFCRTTHYNEKNDCQFFILLCKVFFLPLLNDFFLLPNKAQNFLHLFFLLQSSSSPSHTPDDKPINIFYRKNEFNSQTDF